MIVSDAYSFMFLHVPKCAGTTLRKSLACFDTRRNSFWGVGGVFQKDLPQKEILIDKAHMTLPLMKAYFPEVFSLLGEYTVFATCRHPIPRLISAFFEPRGALYNKFRSSENAPKSIDEVHKRFRKYCQDLAGGGNTSANRSFLHATPQSSYCLYGSKTVVDSYIKIEDPGPGIGRLATMLDPIVIDKLRKAFGGERGRERSTSYAISLWNDLDTETKHKVIDFYSKDFALCGYDSSDFL